MAARTLCCGAGRQAILGARATCAARGRAPEHEHLAAPGRGGRVVVQQLRRARASGPQPLPAVELQWAQLARAAAAAAPAPRTSAFSCSSRAPDAAQGSNAAGGRGRRPPRRRAWARRGQPCPRRRRGAAAACRRRPPATRRAPAAAPRRPGAAAPPPPATAHRRPRAAPCGLRGRTRHGRLRCAPHVQQATSPSRARTLREALAVRSQQARHPPRPGAPRSGGTAAHPAGLRSAARRARRRGQGTRRRAAAMRARRQGFTSPGARGNAPDAASARSSPRCMAAASSAPRRAAVAPSAASSSAWRAATASCARSRAGSWANATPWQATMRPPPSRGESLPRRSGLAAAETRLSAARAPSACSDRRCQKRAGHAFSKPCLAAERICAATPSGILPWCMQ